MSASMVHLSEKPVRHFRQILLWPIQLMPIREGAPIQKHWERLQAPDKDNPWRELADEFTGDPHQFQERHYSEFVTFLPYVQRFLYGEGKGGDRDVEQESCIRVFRRCDVAKVRATFPGSRSVPVTLSVAHVDLYFFYDIDVAILVVEVFADDLPLPQAQNALFRLGRCYPTYWEPDGHGGHCPKQVEWLSSEEKVLAVSDYENREKYLSFACRYRAPSLASHWEFLLEPLVLHHSGKKGLLRYRQIEYHLMPVMAYLVMDDPGALTRQEFVRLGLATAPGAPESLPYSERYLQDFEERYCYDRYWTEGGDGSDGRNTRYLCCGHGLSVVGDASWPFFTNTDTGVLAQFRHQHFLLFMIAHFQKAALLMVSDQLVHALERLEVGNPESVKRFKRAIRQRFEIFLRFTHRYWFHEISEQAAPKALFKMCADHLGLDPLYMEVKERIHDMDEYLNSDSLRRQANTVVRLTVVTILGLIGTVTTGFLGMNLIADADAPLLERVIFFAVILVATAWLTMYTVVKSKRLSDVLDALSDDRLSTKEKFGAIWEAWRDRQR